MKSIIKKSLKTTTSYGAGVFLFTFFLIAPISMENNRNTWIAVYSFVFFVFTVIFLYKQMWKVGEIEKRYAGDEVVSPLRGLFYGIIGFSPFILLEILYFLIYPGIETTFAGNIVHAIFRCAFGPMYFLIRFLHYNWYSYLIATMIIPFVAFVGFLTGLRGTSFKETIGKFRKDEEDFLK